MRFRTAFGGVLIWTLVAAGMASAVNPDHLNSVTFRNKTGYPIHFIFLSPGDSDYWGSDILGSERMLEDGDSLGFFIHYPDECNNFDIMAVDSTGDAYIIENYEICDGTSETIRFSASDAVTDAPDFEFQHVNLRNELAYEIWYMFLSPGDSDMWGVDQMDESTVLEPGDTLSVLVPVAGESVRYDVRAVDEDEDTYTFFVELDGEDGAAFTFAIEPSDLD